MYFNFTAKEQIHWGQDILRSFIIFHLKKALENTCSSLWFGLNIFALWRCKWILDNPAILKVHKLHYGCNGMQSEPEDSTLRNMVPTLWSLKEAVQQAHLALVDKKIAEQMQGVLEQLLTNIIHNK